jgi:hypothetical protein
MVFSVHERHFGSQLQEHRIDELPVFTRGFDITI